MKNLFSVLFTLIVGTSFGQIFNPVKWDSNIELVSDSEYVITWTAIMEPGWSVYSQYLESEDGPIPTTIVFNEGNHFEIIGKAEEDTLNRDASFDNIFEMNVVKYHDRMIIRQHLSISDASLSISGVLTFMTCDNERCLAPIDIEFTLFPSGQPQPSDAGVENSIPSFNSDESGLLLYGYNPGDITTRQNDCQVAVAENTQEKGFWSIFLLGLFGGFLALLTPCVFPMIPLTVSFFTKSTGEGSGPSKAILYGFFILLVYVLLSLPFHLLDSVNPDILNEISTNVWLNLIFFIVFLFFAFSFFGFYEITLPSSWSNKISAAEGVGGILGVFFMALTLALVSFSCTGPILGTLLAGALSSDGGALQLTAGMSGFGFALALPFALFAMFPNWMQKLPKSGSWLNTVKVVLGFLELALALKFLSNADLVEHWGILKIELFYGLWILIFFSLSLYLLGKIRFPHDSISASLSIYRKVFALIALAFTAYLATGFRYSEVTHSYEPLKLLSGLAPPAGYSWVHPNDCPNNLNCFHDLREGIEYATKVNKPIMLDFTGYACVNCRKMEEHVWTEKEVYDVINNDYVLISLYVDDKKPLPDEEKIEVLRTDGGTRILQNYGHKWAHFQANYFQSNSQPFYVLLSSDGKTVLNNPVGYTPDSQEYKQFLSCGIEVNKQLNPFGSSGLIPIN